MFSDGRSVICYFIGLELTTLAAMDVMILRSMMFALRFAFGITVLNYLLSKQQFPNFFCFHMVVINFLYFCFETFCIGSTWVMLDFFTRAILQIRQELLNLKRIGMVHSSESMMEGLSVCSNKVRVQQRLGTSHMLSRSFLKLIIWRLAVPKNRTILWLDALL